MTVWPRSITGQVFGLALICVLTTLGIGLLVTVIMPPPPQASMRVRDVAQAVETGQAGAELVIRTMSASAAMPQSAAQPAPIIAEGLAHALDLDLANVRVTMASDQSRGSGTNLTILNFPPGTLMAGDPPPSVAELVATSDITFPPFQAAVRRGSVWVIVEPASSHLSVWHLKLGLAFLAAATVLAIPTLWLARIFTRPLRNLAAAAEAIDSGPNAPPLPIGGPTEIRTAATALRAMQERLNAHLEQRTQMLFAIAHDLRTPLTSLKLRLEGAGPGLKRVMAPEILRMQAMIDQLLQFAAQPAPKSFEMLDLVGLVRQAADRQPNCAIVVQSPEVLILSGDRLDLSRLLDNVLSNAAKFGGPNPVRIHLDHTDMQARLVVQDGGPGMPDDQLADVLEPFVRIERSRSAETGGVGLGLALAKAVVDRHGGRISLSNAKPSGLIVSINLPLSHGRNTSI
ncbi:HAMP domain-containing sensor histidine kinase [Brevundimonas diminuta]